MATSLEQYHLERLEMESARSRSSTWPLQDPATQPPNNNNGCSNGEAAPAAVMDQQQPGQVTMKRETPECESPIPPGATQQSKSEPKKMRNAWGNMSYAELITQAILSTPEKRLTLSEIYDWIVKNVHYFSDKASSPSTAGWKNSVRHNLSLHSRFVKVQNDTSGKSSWWTVNLDAKSGRTSRRRSHSVDNTNTPSPKSRKKEKRAKIKKVSKGSSTENILSSPCDSPTLAQQLNPWSPNPSCPSPTGSDLSPCYSPSLQSPVMHRGSRNVTPVSPLISPPGLDQQGATAFSGSNSSLDTHTPDFGDPSACADMLAQINLRSSREHMGSSSSISSLNSPNVPLNTKSPHPVFTFNNGAIDSSGYSSSACFSDSELPDCLPPPPAYEEHLAHQNRPVCYTPTRSGTHPLHITLSADMARPRSGSEPAVAHAMNHYNSSLPNDIDMDLISTSEFPDCDVESILQNEMQYENGRLDFSFDQKQAPNIVTVSSTSSPPSSSSSTSAVSGGGQNNHMHNTNNNANLRRTTPPHGYHHAHQMPVTAAPLHQIHHHTTYQVHHHSPSTPPGDPTLTSTAIQANPLLMQGHNLSQHTATTVPGFYGR